MASLARPEDGKIYFITHLASGKVGEIGGSAPVNLAYADTHANTYVSISGTARTSQDRAKLRELWGFFAEAWLPQGPDDPDTALIEVEPEEAKLWDGTRSSLIQTIKMAAAVATQSPPSGGRVEQVRM
jgi:general stress protein 26